MIISSTSLQRVHTFKPGKKIKKDEKKGGKVKKQQEERAGNKINKVHTLCTISPSHTLSVLSSSALSLTSTSSITPDQSLNQQMDNEI
jgi:hypothetical protein